MQAKLFTLFFDAVQMTVTWTSGYNIDEAVPFIEFGVKGESLTRSPAATLTFDQSSMCGMFKLYNLIIPCSATSENSN